MTLPEPDRQLVLRILMDVQHLLVVRNGGTFVEAGTAPEDADETTSHTLDDRDMIERLEVALRALGWRPGDAVPPRVGEQLAARLGRPAREDEA